MNQVLELEEAILARAQQLADQYAEQAQRTRDSVLREASERLRQREQREEAAARALGDRHYRQRVQAAELKLQSNLDGVRWNLLRDVEDRLQDRMRTFMRDEHAYTEYLVGLLREAASQMDAPRLTVRTNADDRERLEKVWDRIRAELPDHELRLDEEPIPTLGGVLLLSENRRERVNNTFEGRKARLRLELQRVILERLLPTSAESGNLFTG
ncbi:V-type ATP synthase subunit E [Thioalkalivibrio sp.]|uniref:V-type ATP synthase subunit E n=1 Tax=Thioalkalivibrio sp. TaxID=2093813 RepID=UPI0035634F20